MNSPLRQLREADLRRRLTELAAEVLKTEEELTALASDEQLKLGAPTAQAATSTPRTPAEKIAVFLNLFGTRRSVYPKRWPMRKPARAATRPLVTTNGDRRSAKSQR